MPNETKIIKNGKTIGGIRVCQRCGKEFVGYWNAQYCPNCLEALKNVAVEPVPKNKKAEYKPTVVKERVCTVCGVRFLGGPRAKYCPECRHEIRKQRDIEQKKRGARRPLGSIDFCKACGKEYIVNSGLQKYCPECAAEQIRERDRERGREYAAEQRKNNPERVKEWKRTKYAETTCPVCGKNFVPAHGKQITCSEQCKVIYSKYRQLISQWKFACKNGRVLKKPTLENAKVLISTKK